MRTGHKNRNLRSNPTRKPISRMGAKLFPGKWVAGLIFLSMADPSEAARKLTIDLDRNTPGIQNGLAGYDPVAKPFIRGSVVVMGNPSDLVSVYSVAILVQQPGVNLVPVDSGSCLISAGEQMDGPPGTVSFARSSNFFGRTSSAPASRFIGSDGTLTLFNFDLRLNCQAGQQIYFSFISSQGANSSLSVTINGQTYRFASGGPLDIDVQRGNVVQCGAAPASLWVDFAFAGTEFGTLNNPYNTASEGVLSVRNSGTVNFKPGASRETLRITKRLRITSPLSGTVRIGDLKAPPGPGEAAYVTSQENPPPGIDPTVGISPNFFGPKELLEFLRSQREGKGKKEELWDRARQWLQVAP